MSKSPQELFDFVEKPYTLSTTEVLSFMEGMFVQDVIHVDDNEELVFIFLNCKVIFYHSQDCCEYVIIDDINGDLNDLKQTVLLVAEERISETAENSEQHVGESNTWTFYTFRTLKGSVDVKWHGSSNGYYSESVNIRVERLT